MPPVRLAILGAGPAGLLFSLLVRRRYPRWRVDVYEQNLPDATFGFGVVFSRGALNFLERDVPDLYRQLLPRMESWPVQRIVHRDESVDIDGNGFSAIARLKLNQFLQELCRDAGVRFEYGRQIASLIEIDSSDLIVGADGLNSLVRHSHESRFQPQVEWLSNKFAWYGTPKVFDYLTLTFRESEHGAFVAHHYRYSQEMSTFIVECDAATWQRAGLDRMSDEDSRVYCEGVFAADLGGHPLVSNKSIWRQFPILHNSHWSAGNAVLIGDALRTIHFSIGSGTRLAFEDAIALDRAFGEAGEDVPRALEAFERERRPVVEKLFAAANRSSYWYEKFPEKMRRFDALGLAYDYMTRSGRMTDERLRQTAPKFMAQVEARRRKGAEGGQQKGAQAMTFKLTSTAFPHDGEIPAKYTCEGDDVSPPLAWSGVPANAKSLALIVDDPDAPDPAAPQMTWVHWVVYNVSPAVTGLPEASRKLPAGALDGLNDWGRTGYGGPCPPIGRHRYFHKLYALDAVLPDLRKPTKAKLEAAMKGHVIAEARLVGTYRKRK